VSAALGGVPGDTNEVLNLRVTVTPSPDTLANATVNSWQLTYDCKPTE
jgi:hypothetical protein